MGGEGVVLEHREDRHAARGQLQAECWNFALAANRRDFEMRLFTKRDAQTFNAVQAQLDRGSSILVRFQPKHMDYLKRHRRHDAVLTVDALGAMNRMSDTGRSADMMALTECRRLPGSQVKVYVIKQIHEEEGGSPTVDKQPFVIVEKSVFLRIDVELYVFVGRVGR